MTRLLADDTSSFSTFSEHPYPTSGGDWVPEAVTIDTGEKLRSLVPDIMTGLLVLSQFMCTCEGRIPVLLRIFRCKSTNSRRFLLSVLNLETKEMRVQEFPTIPFVLLEVDLPSRLRSMKIFR